jgi:hypothetical protein
MPHHQNVGKNHNITSKFFGKAVKFKNFGIAVTIENYIMKLRIDSISEYV